MRSKTFVSSGDIFDFLCYLVKNNSLALYVIAMHLEHY